MLLLTLSCCFMFLMAVNGQEGEKPVEKTGHKNKECTPNYQRMGCQKEDIKDRTMLQDDRSGSTAIWNNDIWKNYPKYLDQLLCVCDILAGYKGFKYFTISYYGQCAGVNDFKANQQVTSNPDKVSCINGEYKNCTITDQDCAGVAYRDAIYLTKKPKVEEAADAEEETDAEVTVPRKLHMLDEYKNRKRSDYLHPRQRQYKSYFPKGEKDEEEIYYPRVAERDDKRRLKFFQRLHASPAKRDEKSRFNSLRSLYGYRQARQEDEPRFNSLRKLHGSRQARQDDEPRFNSLRRLYGSRQARQEEEPLFNSLQILHGSRQARQEDEPRFNSLQILHGSRQAKQEDEPRSNSYQRLYGSRQTKRQDEARSNFFRKLYGLVK